MTNVLDPPRRSNLDLGGRSKEQPSMAELRAECVECLFAQRATPASMVIDDSGKWVLFLPVSTTLCELQSLH